MTHLPTSNPRRRLNLALLLLVALGATLATAPLWPQPLRDRLIRLLGGMPAGESPPAAAASVAEHDDHAHADAHEGHLEANSLELSEQARRSIGLTEGEVALTTFQRSIALPGLVVERRGRSKLSIIAPMTGFVAKIFLTEGEAVAPEQPLFEVRLTHEELVQAQADLLKTAEEVVVVRREIARLEGIGPEGIVAVDLPGQAEEGFEIACAVDGADGRCGFAHVGFLSSQASKAARAWGILARPKPRRKLESSAE